jgi:6,7-dimethyl-8-ribityllumazine synthase
MFVSTPSQVDARDVHIGIAVSRYHREITDSMRDAAIDVFVRSGGRKEHLTIAPAPGTFELSAICRALVEMETEDDEPVNDAIVAIGCVISGQTTHDQYITQSVTQGLTAITTDTGVPVAFGVLTCQTIEQARARSIDAASHKGVNKGAEAMIAALETVHTIRALSKARVSR